MRRVEPSNKELERTKPAPAVASTRRIAGLAAQFQRSADDHD